VEVSLRKRALNKKRAGQARELPAAEIRRVDRCLTGTRYELRDRTLFYLGLGSGMRIGEMIALRVLDVAPYGKVLDEITLERKKTKSKKSRTVALSDQAVSHLKGYLKQRFPDGHVRTEEALFPSQVGRRPLGRIGAHRALSSAFRRAAVSNVSTHSLRRTFANALRKAGVDMKIIQDQLGHSSLAITERYFKLDPVEKRQAVKSLRF
jgi:integrase/recombinase XerD